jgi:subfamily B ATP-binding cassette protein MsbA
MRTVPLVQPPPAGTGLLSPGAVLRRLMRDYVSRQWHLFAGGILALLLAAAAGGVLPQLVKLELKQIFDKGSPSWLLPLSLIAFATIALRAVGMFAGRALIDTLGEKAVASAQHDMFRSLIRSDLAALNALHSGQFISSFLYDATLLRDAFTLAVAAIFLEAVSLVCYLGYALWVDWQLCLLALVATPAVAWAMERLGGSIRRAATRGMRETGDLSVALSEAMDGRRIVKAYGLEDHVTGRIDASLASRLRTLVKAVRLRAAAAPATEIFMGVVIALVLYVAGWQHLQGELTADTFGGFLTALLLAQQPVRNLSQLWPSAMPGVAAANRIFEAIDARPTILDAPGAGTLRVEPAPRGGGVRFRNVSFAYHGAIDTAVSGIDLEIPPGSKVALVGPSGAGKSTIFNLLLRFYDIEGGAITIDSADIRDVTLASLRANIGMVTQEQILFDESVADNIALGKPGAARAEIERAARDAAAHDFIMELPQGYDTRVGEGGLKLSGGQRQRIAIARAMLKNAPILLLDEATSALDTSSERQVQEALNRLMHDRTTIVIAHRLSTVLDASRIYVLDKGGVAEAGTHAELMTQGGLYAGLYRYGLDGAA